MSNISPSHVTAPHTTPYLVFSRFFVESVWRGNYVIQLVHADHDYYRHSGRGGVAGPAEDTEHARTMYCAHHNSLLHGLQRNQQHAEKRDLMAPMTPMGKHGSRGQGCGGYGAADGAGSSSGGGGSTGASFVTGTGAGSVCVGAAGVRYTPDFTATAMHSALRFCTVVAAAVFSVTSGIAAIAMQMASGSSSNGSSGIFADSPFGKQVREAGKWAADAPCGGDLNAHVTDAMSMSCE